MKYVASAFILLLPAQLFGGDIRGFEHFKAPNVVGAYEATWNPLGPTVEGFNFSVGFYLNDGGESSPTHFWIPKKNNVMIEVNSITAVNCVIGDLEFKSRDASLRSIDAACKMVKTHEPAYGPSGLSLDFYDPKQLQAVVARLRAVGLDDATADLLLSLGSKASRSVDQTAHKWTAMWYEIDKLGGVQRVTLSGSLEPFNVASVLKEVVHSAAKVRPDILKRENFYDLSER